MLYSLIEVNYKREHPNNRRVVKIYTDFNMAIESLVKDYDGKLIPSIGCHRLEDEDGDTYYADGTGSGFREVKGNPNTPYRNENELKEEFGIKGRR